MWQRFSRLYIDNCTLNMLLTFTDNLISLNKTFKLMLYGLY